MEPRRLAELAASLRGCDAPRGVDLGWSSRDRYRNRAGDDELKPETARPGATPSDGTEKVLGAARRRVRGRPPARAPDAARPQSTGLPGMVRQLRDRAFIELRLMSARSRWSPSPLASCGHRSGPVRDAGRKALGARVVSLPMRTHRGAPRGRWARSAAAHFALVPDRRAPRS